MGGSRASTDDAAPTLRGGIITTRSSVSQDTPGMKVLRMPLDSPENRCSSSHTDNAGSDQLVQKLMTVRKRNEIGEEKGEEKKIEV